MSVQPIGKFIALEAEHEQIKTDAGLLMTGEGKDELLYQKAKVLAVGNLVEVIKEGDLVYYHKAGCFSMLIEGKNIIWTTERDILCVL